MTYNLFYTDITTKMHLDFSKTVFWVGAGICADPPCSLPLGNKLADAYLYSMLRDDHAKDFILFWNNHIISVRDAIKNGEVQEIKIGKDEYTMKDLEEGRVMARPRLEYIIGEFSKLDEEFGCFSFSKPENNIRFHRESSIEALKYFADAEPNNCHRWISEFVKRGSRVITTNYDVCIEKALGVDQKTLSKPDTIYGIKAIRYGNDEEDYVYHIHGIATDSEIAKNLGATIRNVSKPFPREFRQRIRGWLADGYDFIFMGYSGMDFFDVRPFFEEILDKAPYKGSAVYVSHCRNEEEAKKRCDNVEEMQWGYLLAPFNRNIVCWGQTEDFLRSVGNATGIKDTSKEENVSCSAFEKTKNALDNIALSYNEKDGARDDFYFINMFRLCSQLNINPEIFYSDWSDRVERICNRWQMDSPDTIERMFRSSRQLNDCLIDDIRFNNWDSKNKNYIKTANSMNKLVGEWTTMHKTRLRNHMNWYSIPPSKKLLAQYVSSTCRYLEEGIKEPEDENIERDTMMFFYSKQIKKWMLAWKKFPFLRNFCNKKLRSYLPYYDDLLKYPFSRFMYRTYYLFPCRFRNIIHVMTDKKIDNSADGLYGDLQHEWDICMETPNLFDARKTIKNRIEQLQILEMRSVEIDRNKLDQLNKIYEYLDGFRKDIQT